ncbi:Putative oxidoreductase [Cronobacter condimenti 1330]|uniref:Putative oxidoreductase n=1 Tax=Cronobacter condimenti 1330 TaxID=1073999 RepID=K8AC63_9ENTR|nr:Putative oxidoreductase [Cronobacter condimenti 1330]
MGLVYKDDEDLNFLQHCTEVQLQVIARLLTYDENGKQRLASELLKHQQFQALDSHPERHRRCWQLIAGELQHFGGDSIANKGHGLLYRSVLHDLKSISGQRAKRSLLDQMKRR